MLYSDFVTFTPTGQQNTSETTITGFLASSNKEYVFFQIDEGFHEFSNRKKFKVCFNSSRVMFQLQHNALDFMQKHELIEMIKMNPAYYEQCEQSEFNLADYKFRYLSLSILLSIHHLQNSFVFPIAASLLKI